MTEPINENSDLEVKIPAIRGVFSSETIEKIGSGTTVRRTVMKAFWFVFEEGSDTEGNPKLLRQALSVDNLPAGDKKPIEWQVFLADYTPETDMYQKEVFPKLKELEETLEIADADREKGALYSAQFEYEAALDIDMNNVRANFGLGITYLQRGDADKANTVFERIVKLDAAFATEHTHLFNEFGINLRKSGLYAQAVQYYGRAMELVNTDEHLLYNRARAAYGLGETEACAADLAQALELNSSFTEAQLFLTFIEKHLANKDGAEASDGTAAAGA